MRIDSNSRYDASRLPRLREYIDQLPDGLEAHFECKAKASVVRKVYEFSNLPLGGLPAPLQTLLDEPPPLSAWVPQCHALALILAMVEARELAPKDEGAWVREAAAALFASPLYKILMWAGTPRLIFKSAKIRWSAFFRGSALESTVEERIGTVVLGAPRYLFNEDLAYIFEQVIWAALNYSKDEGSGASLVLTGYRNDRVEYTGRW